MADPAFAAFAARVAARVPAAGAPVDVKTRDFITYALTAAGEALTDAGLAACERRPYASERFGVAVGTGIANIGEIADVALTLYGGNGGGKGASHPPDFTSTQRKVSPFFVPRILTNMAAGQISIRHGLRGPNHAVSTACATGAHALGDAFRFIKHGDADAMLAGGSEASIHPLAFAGFGRAKALATAFNERPAAASRPFDAGRNGFVLGEGAGVVVLEELDAALARGARIYAEIRGYGACGDAHHITAPADDGDGAYRCMTAALVEGGVAAPRGGDGKLGLVAPVDYVNAHATSTPLGDNIEAYALGRLFGSVTVKAGHTHLDRAPSHSGRGDGRVLVSSTKGAMGHLLGAAGAVEAIAAIKAVHEDIVPPTLNLEQPEDGLPVDVCDFVTAATRRRVRVALNNSFGFGGTNCSLLFTKWEGQ